MNDTTNSTQQQNWILSANCALERISELGGKAGNLRRLSHAGVSVPPWLCLSTYAFRSLAAGSIQEYLANTSAVDAAADNEARQYLRAKVLGVFVASGLADLLDSACQEHLPAVAIAVRSSATVEDSEHYAFSGQFSSYLNVARTSLRDSVVDCWLSLVAPGVLSYLQLRNIPWTEVQMAVIVQEMVPAFASGVCFTVNPNGSDKELVCVAGYGLGEGVVTDKVETDSYIYHKDGGHITTHIAAKIRQVLQDHNSTAGTTIKPVPSQLQHRPAINRRMFKRLAAQALTIEAMFCAPQDIEWATDAQDKLHILQTRPVTARRITRKFLYDNANIVEGYPGISSPLTASVIRQGYGDLFRNFILDLGVPAGRVVRNRQVFESLLGYMQGRMYLNLNSWYGFFSLIPGTGAYVRTWEQMMGLFPRSGERTGGLTGFAAYLEMFRIISRMIGVFLTLDGRCRRFHNETQELARTYWRASTVNDELSDLEDAYWRLYKRLTVDMVITLYNDGYAFIFTGLAGKLLRTAGHANAERLLNQLLFTGSELPSMAPVRSLMDLAQQVRSDKGLRHTLDSVLAQVSSEKELTARLPQAAPKFSGEFFNHIEQFGDRFIAELKLENPSARDQPTELLRMILSYADREAGRAPAPNDELMRQRSSRSFVRELFAGKPLLAALFKGSLFFARRSVCHREALRLDRARHFGMLRDNFLRIGASLRGHGVLADPQQVFYLEAGQIFGFIHGNSANPQLAALADMQRTQADTYQQLRPANRFIATGSPFIGAQIPCADASTALGTTLMGQGCAPGIVEAEALVLRDHPDTSLDVSGKILVAEMTDPGWVYLMIPAAGLVSERGSILSHTAIIGRELGIATIVGAQDATRAIQTGDRLRINGTTGEITKLGAA